MRYRKPGRITSLMRSGFTLVELMVAITISAGLLLAGRTVMEQAAETSHELTRTGIQFDSAFTRTNELHSLVRNIETRMSDSMLFNGTEHIIHFWSWCDSAAGLRGQCQVTWTLDTLLIARTSISPKSIVLLRPHTPAVFRYLGDARQGGVWYRTWGAGITLPLAIGIVSSRDTLVLRVGDRG